MQPRVRLYPKSYSGRDPKKLAKYRAEADAAQRIEDYLNERIVPDEPQTFDYADIALDLGISRDVVTQILFRYRGGHNGITI